MKRDNFNFWYLFLFWANILTLAIGLLIAFAGNAFLFDFHNTGTEHAFNNGFALSGDTLALKNWLFGIIGATMAGFNILAVFILKFAFKERRIWAWNALFVGISVWFVIDSAVSFYYGADYNVYAVNIPALLSFYIPLGFSRKYFHNIGSKPE